MSDINVPIQVRSNELTQLHEWVPTLAGKLQQAELDERAEQMQRIYEEHIDITHTAADDPAIVTYVSMPAEDWRALIRESQRLTDERGVTRVNYLRRKLGRRLRDRMDEMDIDTEEDDGD